MKRILTIVMAVMTVSVLYGGTAHAGHGHFRGSVWIGPGFWPVYPYYSQPYYVQPPPVVIREAPEQYIRKDPDVDEGSSYWYYCRKPEGYYPYVRTCPDGWMKVVPSQTPPDVKE